MKLPTTVLLAVSSMASASWVRIIHQFPADASNSNATSWIENIAVRPNGNLLVTLLSPAPELHEIIVANPSSSTAAAAQSSRLIHRFTSSQGLLGIAETAPDVFALIAGSYTTTPPGWALWEADFASTITGRKSSDDAPAKITALIPAIPSGLVLNGLTTLSPSSSSSSSRNNDAVLLMSDSAAGVVLRVDLASSSTSTFLADAQTMAPPNATLPTGVNGVRYRRADGHLYYVNTYRGLFCRVRVEGEEAIGAVEVLAEGILGDDFALREEKEAKGLVAYVMDGVNGQVVRLHLGSGKKEVLLTGQKPTSAQFGRAAGDAGTLYVATRDGKVLAIGGF